MTELKTMESFVPDEDLIAEYHTLAADGYADGALGRLLVVVSTSDLTMARGDLYVALGLAKYLRRAGWGITLWPTERWTERTPEGFHSAIVMIETFVPGLVHPDTHLIAWVRNWTERWADLPYLDVFSQVWCSSISSADRIREVFEGPVEVLPLATDPEIFHPEPAVPEPGVVTTANFWGVDRGLIPAVTALSEREPVTWFGKNARFLQIPSTIDHRHTVDYFSLGWVYSAWKFVIDDVIDAAAVYGTQNSRLFDAIACGAIVITNTTNGLDELGLEQVPTYGAEAPLVDVVARLRSNPDATEELAQRLASVVRERHTYAVRAELASALLSRRVDAAAERSVLLGWTTLLREEYRQEQFVHSDLRVSYHEQYRELVVSRRHIELLEELVERQPGRRLRRALSYLKSPRRLLNRLRAGFGE